MQLPMRLFAAVVATLAAGSVAESVTPVQKVVQMLMGMLEKGKKEKHDEQVQFASYRQFCEDTDATVSKQIHENEEKITMLKADIQKYSTGVEDLGREITELEGDVSTFHGDAKASTKVRELERVEYEKTHKDYTDSIDAICKAVAVLKKQDFDRAQAEALLQGVVSFKKVPAASRRAIEAFLASDSEEQLLAAPEANAYEFQSHSVIDMLEKLGDKFVEERTALEKDEMNSRHAYNLLQQDLKDSISSAEAAIATKTTSKARDAQKMAARQGDLEDTTSTMNDDTKYLDEVKGSCTQKSNNFQARQKLREDEIVAIEKAVEVLGSVQGAADKHLPAMLQAPKHGAAVLLQLRSDKNANPDNQMRMAAYLNEEATRIGSKTLSMIATRATEDPFSKVKTMIRDLITRLEEQAGEEASHKAWCDTELAENEKVRKTRTASVDNLKSEIEELSASIAKAGAQIAEYTKQVAELDANVAKETEMRAKDKADNEMTIKDATDAQAAVARALVVLKEFYAEAGEATALVQKKTKQDPAAPDVFGDEPYKGMGGESGGVIGMLEVIQSDFARLESDTRAAEASQGKAHNDFMSESAVTKAQKQSDITHKTASKQREEMEMMDKQNNLMAEEKELDTANNYFDKLKPSCLDAGMSFAEREARRQEEIQSLQEALRILNGEDIALLQKMQKN